MPDLSIAPGFDLPLQAVTETFAILAKRGSGKTSTAVVLTEELLGAGQQVIVVDPTGVWWGLRANRNGGPGGLPIVIIGGDHADLPLTERSTGSPSTWSSTRPTCWPRSDSPAT